MTTAREKQIEEALRLILAKDAAAARYRFFGGNNRPRFIWTTQRVMVDGEMAWVSFVALSTPVVAMYDPIPQSIVGHAKRRDARARAFNLFTGWELGVGVRKTPSYGWTAYA